MKLFELLNNCEHKIVQGIDVDIKHLTIDSRKARAGSLFFCIKGFKVDARQFIEGAVNYGAVAVCVEDLNGVNVPENVTLVLVDDARKAMALVAANFYGHPYKSFKTIGVTGTNGKTSTTYFLEAIFNETNATTGVIGTVGVVQGGEKLNIAFDTSTTPDPIELHKIFQTFKEKNTTHCFMEVTSHALALNKLAGVTFDCAIFTNLTQDHLDLHGSMENYRSEKAKLFAMADVSIINIDDAASEYMIKAAKSKVVTFGIDNDCDLRATNINYLNDGVIFSININGNDEQFSISVAGKFSVYNALGAIGAALSQGVSVEDIRNALKKMNGVPGRIQSVPNSLGINVVVDYAHTPDGLENVLNAVRGYTKGNVITVFGCGGDRDRTKRPIMGGIAGKLSSYCIITSDNPRTEEPNSILDMIEPGMIETGCKYEKIVDRREAIFRATELAEKNDTVVIAGKGHENYQIFADRTIHFDDYEVALEAISNLGGEV